MQQELLTRVDALFGRLGLTWADMVQRQVVDGIVSIIVWVVGILAAILMLKWGLKQGNKDAYDTPMPIIMMVVGGLMFTILSIVGLLCAPEITNSILHPEAQAVVNLFHELGGHAK